MFNQQSVQSRQVRADAQPQSDLQSRFAFSKPWTLRWTGENLMHFLSLVFDGWLRQEPNRMVQGNVFSNSQTTGYEKRYWNREESPWIRDWVSKARRARTEWSFRCNSCETSANTLSLSKFLSATRFVHRLISTAYSLLCKWHRRNREARKGFHLPQTRVHMPYENELTSTSRPGTSVKSLSK